MGAQSGGKIPATVITGFLGAGKTTLIRTLMESAEARDLGRIALIVNEFGALGFDGALLEECSDPVCRADVVYELANGCICCTVAEDFLPTMETLLTRDPAPDRIVIETSGLALPQPLIRAFAWPSVKSRVTVDGVIVVADMAALAIGAVTGDSATLAAQREADESIDHDDPIEELFEDQLRCADLIVLNKADLVDPQRRANVRVDIAARVRPGVEIIAAAHGRLPASILLGVEAEVENDMAGRESHHDFADANHDHDDFTSFAIATPVFISTAAARQAISAAMMLPGVLRIKGAVAIQGKSAPMFVQAVGRQIETWFATRTMISSRLIVIGLKNMSSEELDAALGTRIVA